MSESRVSAPERPRRPASRARLAAALCTALVLFPRAGSARILEAAARDGAAAAAIAEAAAGDTVRLAAGVHRGPLSISGHALVLCGAPGAVVMGAGRGTVIEVRASGTILQDLEVRHSGARVITADAGVRVVTAQHVSLRRVRMRDVLYGVYAERADSLGVEDCDLEGRVAPLNESGEGNGVHLWYCRGVSIARTRVSRFLDGIYLSFADGTQVASNTLSHNGRYGLHTMYCQRNTLVRNRFDHNVAGIAIMFSNRLRVAENRIVHNHGPRTYGLLLRDCSDGLFEENALVDNTIAVFLDGSNRNRFRRNLIQDNGWGALVFASSAGNVWAENDFINNDYPVALDMRFTRNHFDDGKRGNYWSDATPYDLDGDGVSDVSFGPVTAFAFMSKQYPDLSVLSKSPAVAALGVAERVFPALRPSEAIDHFPSVRPVTGGGTVSRDPAARAQPAWGAAALFAGLSVAGIVGLIRSQSGFRS